MADNQHNAHILDLQKNTDKQSYKAVKELQKKKKHFLYSHRINKAVYTAALVADGWAGAENLEKSFVTDRKVGYGVASPRLKMAHKVFNFLSHRSMQSTETMVFLLTSASNKLSRLYLEAKS